MIDYYVPFISIECMHNYYTNGLCPDLCMEPTAECRELLTAYRLLFKQRSNGGIVISEQKNTGTEAVPVLEPKIPIDAGKVFTFKFTLKNPLFLNITDTDLGAIGPYSVFVFTNEPEDPVIEEDGIQRVTIHSGALSGPIQAVGKVFRYPVDHSLDPVSLAVYDESGLFLFKIPVDATMPEKDLDLNGYPEGTYEVRSLDAADAVVVSHRFFVSNDFLSSRLFGFLQIHISEEMVAPGAGQYAFILEFAGRSIPWFYKIIVKPKETDPAAELGEELDINEIELVDAPVDFSKEVIPGDPPGSGQVNFSSDTPIQLREQPYNGIQLKIVSNGGETEEEGEEVSPDVLVKHMPNPGIDRLLKDEASGLRAEMSLTINK